LFVLGLAIVVMCVKFLLMEVLLWRKTR